MEKIRPSILAVVTILAAVCVVFSGCATVSKIPGVSMVVDAFEGYRLATTIMTDNSISDEEIRSMMERPLPPPSGMSYSVALLRRSAAATALGKVDIVEACYQLALKNKERKMDVLTPGIREYLAKLVVFSNAYSGNIIRAKKMGLKLEKYFSDQARSRGAQAYTWVAGHADLYYAMLGIATALGDRVMFNHLIEDYPQTIDFSKKKTPIKDFYLSGRLSLQATLLGEEGDYEAARSAWKKLENIIKKRSDFSKNGLAIVETMRQLSEYSIMLHEPETAIKYINELKKIKCGSKEGTCKALLLSAESLYLSSIGKYKESAEKKIESFQLMPRMIRIGKIYREDYLEQLSMVQLCAGQYTNALASIRSMGDLNSLSIKSRKAPAIATTVYAHIAQGVISQQLPTLDSMDAMMSGRLGTDKARFHFAVKTIGHYFAYRKQQSAEDLKNAVAGGRLFSKSYRKMLSTGQYKDIMLPPDIYRKAKESYLLAAVSAAGKYGVTLDDVLDAFSLYYYSDTDEAVSSAAMRTRVPGLSRDEMRRLQDLRLQARKTIKRLDMISKYGDAATIQKAAESMERANRVFEAEVNGLKTRAPNLFNAFAVSAPSLSDIRKKLMPKEALVALAPTADGTAVLVVSKKKVSSHVYPVDSDTVQELTRRIRRSVKLEMNMGGNLIVPPFDTAAASSLFQKCLAPSLADLRRVRRLSVITGRSFGRIPFGLLLTKPASGENYGKMNWLIKKYAVSHAPSISAWILSGENIAGSRNRKTSFLAWADPFFGDAVENIPPQNRGVRRGIDRIKIAHETEAAAQPLGRIDFASFLPRLPETRVEAETVARAVGADPVSAVVSGKAATRESVLAASENGRLGGMRIVMFATHGLVPDDLPGLSQPALAMAKNDESDAAPLLMLDDVVGLRMNADWVILSACNTSAADTRGGDPLSGLARGFFFAGAKSLLVTHWSVESKSAQNIMERTMKRYAKTRKTTGAQALQSASLAFISGKNVPAAWAHPAFWAPYVVVGNGKR